MEKLHEWQVTQKQGDRLRRRSAVDDAQRFRVRAARRSRQTFLGAFSAAALGLVPQLVLALPADGELAELVANGFRHNSMLTQT